MRPLDDADRAKAGTLPNDPSEDTVKAKPKLRSVGPEEWRQLAEPCDIGAERALLGALLWSGQYQPNTLRVSAVVDLLDSGAPFYQRGHGNVFDACKACQDGKQEHDPVAVHAALLRLGHRSDLERLRELVADASTVSEAQVRVYAQAIRNAWARREVIREARALIEEAKSPKAEADTIITKAQSVAQQYVERSACTSASVSIKESAVKFFERIEKGGSQAMPTGIHALDDALNGGLRPAEVTIVAARTSVGKSVLSAQIAEHIVMSDPSVGVLYVTLEMTHEMFTARLVSARSGVPLNNLRRMVLNQSQMSGVMSAINDLAGRGLYFADSPSQTLSAIYAAAKERARLLAREGKRLGLVVIDHIGLVKPSAELLKKASREQQVAETSRGQRVIAAELGCHVLGLAQIHREAERQTTQSMPKLHHLRESGSLEQDADTILILHRERDQKTGLFRQDKPAALALAKGRLDETAIMLLDYDGSRARFGDWMGPESFGDFYGGQR